MWKLVILTIKMVKSIFEIIWIFTAAKIHTSNFVDTPFDTDYCTYSKIIPHRAKYFKFVQCIFFLKSNSADIFIFRILHFFKTNFIRKDIFQNGIPGQTLFPPSRYHSILRRQRIIKIFLYHLIMDTVYLWV